jgi:hypothetical protein
MNKFFKITAVLILSFLIIHLYIEMKYKIMYYNTQILLYKTFNISNFKIDNVYFDGKIVLEISDLNSMKKNYAPENIKLHFGLDDIRITWIDYKKIDISLPPIKTHTIILYDYNNNIINTF